VTLLADDGVTPLGATELVRNVDGHTRTPRSLNWNTEVDRDVNRNLTIRVGYQQRSTRSEPIIDTDAAGVGRSGPSAAWRRPLTVSRSAVVARYQFHGSDQLVGSYTPLVGGRRSQ